MVRDRAIAGIRPRGFAAALVVALLSASSALSGSAVEGLGRWLSGTVDLECRFDQRLVSGALGADARESGVLYVERPGKLRWDYLDPERKTVLVNGDRTVLYVHEDRQWIRGRLSEEQGILPALLAGGRPLGDLFVATEVDAGGERGKARVKLVPRRAPEGVEEILLTLGERDHAIERAEVRDGAGNRVEYRFSRLKRNRGIDPGLFALEPPPGVEVLGEP
jgi:outer membrane lipoprotein carrier protein